MGVLDKLNDRLQGMVAKLEKATSRTAGNADTVGGAGANPVGAAMLTGNQRNLDAAVKAETRARNAATKALEAEAAEKRALLPQLRAQARLAAFTSRTEEEHARQQQAALRLNRVNGPRVGNTSMSISDFSTPWAGYSANMEDFGLSRMTMNLGHTLPRGISPDDFASFNVTGAMQRGWRQDRRARAAARSAMLDKKYASPEGSIGLMSSLGGRLGIAGAGLYAAQHELEADTRQINIRNRSDLTEGQKARMGLEETVFVGGIFKAGREFIQALDGTTEALRRMKLETERESGSIGGRWQAARERQGITAEASAANIRLNSLRANPYAELETGFDRTSLGGQLAYSQYQRRLPLMDSLVRAQREAQSSRGIADFSRARSDQSNAYLRHLESRQSIALGVQARYRGGNQAQLFQNASNAFLATQDVTQGRSTSISDEQTARQDAANAIRREADVRNGLVGLLDDELSKLKEKEARIRGNAQRIGSMSPFERQHAVLAADAIEKYGLDNVPMQMRAAFGRAAPDYLYNLETQHGLGLPEYQQFVQRGIFQDTESLADVHAQQNQAQANIRLVISLDEGRLAQMLSENFNRGYADLIRRIEAEVEDQRTEFNARHQMQTAQE